MCAHMCDSQSRNDVTTRAENPWRRLSNLRPKQQPTEHQLALTSGSEARMKVAQQKSCTVRSNATVVPVIRTSLKSSRRGPTRGCGSSSRGVAVISAAAATLVETSTYMPSITYTSDMLIGKFYVPAMVLPLTFQRLVARSTGDSFRSVAVVHEMDMLAPGEGEVGAGTCKQQQMQGM